MTFDEVIEKHRALRGAVQLRVTAGPDATPEGLDAALAEIWRKLDIYNAFSREEQLEAQLARMHGKLEAIDRMARRGDTDRSSPRPTWSWRSTSKMTRTG